jgi:hypothetical protein
MSTAGPVRRVDAIAESIKDSITDCGERWASFSTMPRSSLGVYLDA